MKVILHSGTEKTGSSFIQSNLTLHRNYLKENDIHYPKDYKWEARSKKGQISPGNAEQLMFLLKKKEWNKIENWLIKRRDEAKNNRLNVLLLSNENLIVPLSDKATFDRFLLLLQEINFTKIRYILILRDPVDQALSLFKHRAKNGEIQDIKFWLNNGYSLHRDLEGFLGNMEGEDNSCTILKYNRDGSALLNNFFENGLYFTAPDNFFNEQVNASLTLSELALIRKIRLKSPNLVNYVYERLFSLANFEKVKDVNMEQYARVIIGREMANYSKTWELCNRHLKNQDKLVIPVDLSWSENEIAELVFSEKQLDEITSVLLETSTLKFKINLWLKLWIRPVLGKMKWTLIKISGKYEKV